MSTIAERARIEAERAEAEQPDEEEEAAGDEEEVPAAPEPEPEPAQAPLTELQAERVFKKLESAAQRYLKAAMPLTEELGMPVQACPLCAFPGLAIPRAAHEVTSDVESAVLALIGKQVAPKLVKSDQYYRCPACDGWGEVDTDAQKEISKAAMCTACGGKGFLLRTNVTPIVPPQPAPAYPGQGVTYTPLPSGLPDQWSRPAGHPHWGLEPSQVGS